MFITTNLIALLSLSTLSLALPTSNLNSDFVSVSASAPLSSSISSRQTTPEVTITLIDATQHEYPVTIPSTQTWTPTDVIQSISHVEIANTGYVPCAFFGIDGAVILSMPGDVKSMDVGPPQVIVGGICGPWRGDE